MTLRVSLLCLIMLVNSTQLLAQNNGNGVSSSAVENSRVSKVRFSGNENVRNSTLELLVRTRSNRKLLNIPGFTVWYWLNTVDKNWGEPPNRLDREVVSADMDRIKAYYRSVGYLDANVDTIIVDYGKNRFEVSFLINEGRRAIIRQIKYSGFPEFDNPDAIQRFFRRSLLAERRINDTTYTSNKPFSYDLIGQERTSIMNSLRNNGFVSVQRDSVRAIIERPDSDPFNLSVLFLISPGRKFYFGDVYLNVDGPNQDDNEARNFEVGPPQTSDSTRIYIRREEEAYTRFSLLTDNIMFRPGDVFSYDRYLLTVRRFQNINMINVRQFGLSADGSLPDYSQRSLPVRIDMQTLPRHNIRFDVFGMQRLGFGAGAGLRYQNNNLIRRGESLEIGLNGSFENAPNVTAGLLRSLEGTIQYSHSRLTWPFGFLSDNTEFINSRTNYQISLAQISQINFNVNGNLRFNLNFQIQHNPTTTSTLDLIEFDWFDASPTPRFIEQIIEEVTDPLQQERILNDFSQQFNSTLRYTLRRSNTDIVQRNNGFYSEYTIELAGTIPFLIERYLVRPGEPLQSTIPSLTLADSTLSYSRFIKAYIDLRNYIPLTESATLAWRGFAGMAYAYGVNTQIPLNRRFFAGGSNDIRGWPPLRLGPGDLSISSVTVNGADIKLTTFLEARQVLIRNFLSTNWSFATFIDAGNIWNGPRSRFSDGKFRFNSFFDEIAIGTGIGIRLDWEYVIFRVDMAWRAYDPARDDGSLRGWFNNSNSYIHFGIGHAF